MCAKEKIEEKLSVETEEQNLNEIVLYNDDVNTFDHVIDTLIYACDHTPEQADNVLFWFIIRGNVRLKLVSTMN